MQTSNHKSLVFNLGLVLVWGLESELGLVSGTRLELVFLLVLMFLLVFWLVLGLVLGVRVGVGVDLCVGG